MNEVNCNLCANSPKNMSDDKEKAKCWTCKHGAAIDYYKPLPEPPEQS